ncbi:Flp pilus assembly protein TadG [Arthrobacter crystallopoietes BAB-32]|uniref:Flp pilus assembly protein TadG n=1 Tax=Arthrobacter crystallopoietes BAB-32 TaxID=1246476 RepID=N1UTY9_9MICC|nr:pilus assembly protein TadG-related protein [Arthrobacter crystallopoietes]EMY33876.1 Flp pilus assembly protein TadG [Arthrobacter crystallopoietes BAB-32]
MQRLKDERGAVAVTTAIFMVVLLGMAALVVDIGALYYERAQLKNGADSAALAVAQNCAAGNCGMDFTALASSLAGQNAQDGLADASVALDPAQASVSVTTSTRSSDGHTLAQAFAPILGLDDSATVTTRSTARWSAPVAGTAVLPIAISYCQFAGMLDAGIQRVDFNPNRSTASGCSSSSIPGYTGPAYTIPGGFGWLKQDPSQPCRTRINVSASTLPEFPVDPEVGGDTGNDLPAACKNNNTLSKIVNTTVLLPIYDEAGGTGTNAWYNIMGFAAFELSGWNFSGSAYNNLSPAAVACTGSCRALIGEFVTFVTLDAGEQKFTFGGTPNNFGTNLVSLAE